VLPLTDTNTILSLSYGSLVLIPKISISFVNVVSKLIVPQTPGLLISSVFPHISKKKAVATVNG
jgi:hypothetical protein